MQTQQENRSQMSSNQFVVELFIDCHLVFLTLVIFLKYLVRALSHLQLDILTNGPRSWCSQDRGSSFQFTTTGTCRPVLLSSMMHRQPLHLTFLTHYAELALFFPEFPRQLSWNSNGRNAPIGVYRTQIIPLSVFSLSLYRHYQSLNEQLNSSSLSRFITNHDRE